MYRNCPQYPMPYGGLEMQNPYFGMEYPYFPGMEMQYPYYPCPIPGPIPGPGPGPGPGPVNGYPPAEVQMMVREMLEMVRSIYEQECP